MWYHTRSNNSVIYPFDTFKITDWSFQVAKAYNGSCTVSVSFRITRGVRSHTGLTCSRARFLSPLHAPPPSRPRSPLHVPRPVFVTVGPKVRWGRPVPWPTSSYTHRSASKQWRLAVINVWLKAESDAMVFSKTNCPIIWKSPWRPFKRISAKEHFPEQEP